MLEPRSAPCGVCEIETETGMQYLKFLYLMFNMNENRQRRKMLID
jgi:hypothetical protein